MAEVEQSADIAWKSIYDDYNLYSCLQYSLAKKNWNEHVKDKLNVTRELCKKKLVLIRGEQNKNCADFWSSILAPIRALERQFGVFANNNNKKVATLSIFLSFWWNINHAADDNTNKIMCKSFLYQCNTPLFFSHPDSLFLLWHIFTLRRWQNILFIQSSALSIESSTKDLALFKFQIWFWGRIFFDAFSSVFSTLFYHLHRAPIFISSSFVIFCVLRFWLLRSSQVISRDN